MPIPTDLEILHLDAALVAVHKPSGLLSVPGRGPLAHDSAAQRLQQRYADAKVVHRLDMGTSGILLFARGLQAQRSLSAQFERRETEKGYVAVVRGLVRADSGEIDAPLIADWPRRPLQKVDTASGKPSLTRYQVVRRDAAAGTTRLALTPVTGRSHQLRVHLAFLGHPILGDTLYAPPEIAERSPRLLLHAHTLSVNHPQHGTRLSLVCEVPF